MISVEFLIPSLAVFIVFGLIASIFSTQVMLSENAGLAILKVFAGSFAALGLKLAFSERT